MKQHNNPTARPAVVTDSQAIADLINIYAMQELVLFRTKADIIKHISNFIVAEDSDDKVIACCAARDFSNGLFEIRSLAVNPEKKGLGYGRIVIKATINRLLAKGVAKKIFALTYQGGFFEKMGFHKVNKEIFPEKIWSDCSNCPKKDCCDEEAYLLNC